MYACKSARIPFLSACLVAASFSLASAQSVDFQVGNFSLEQAATVTMQNTGPANFLGRGDGDPDIGSSSVILQAGTENSAFTNLIGDDAGIAALQAGDRNQSLVVIENSPGSVAGTVQLGNDNFAAIGILGGQNNTVATAQVGNNLGALVGLVDSVDTTVTYGQAGQNYNGAIVIKNAPAGTRVRVN